MTDHLKLSNRIITPTLLVLINQKQYLIYCSQILCKTNRTIYKHELFLLSIIGILQLYD